MTPERTQEEDYYYNTYFRLDTSRVNGKTLPLSILSEKEKVIISERVR